MMSIEQYELLNRTVVWGLEKIDKTEFILLLSNDQRLIMC